MTEKKIFAGVDVGTLFLSVEPIIGPVTLLDPELSAWVNWIIIGKATGPKRSKYRLDPKWVNDLTEQCQNMHIPVFHKDNLGGMATVFEFPVSSRQQQGKAGPE